MYGCQTGLSNSEFQLTCNLMSILKKNKKKQNIFNPGTEADWSCFTLSSIGSFSRRICELSPLRANLSITVLLCASGHDGLQQRRPAVPPEGDRRQRGRNVLRRGHGQTQREEEEEEEAGAGRPDHCLNPRRRLDLEDRFSTNICCFFFVCFFCTQ